MLIKPSLVSVIIPTYNRAQTVRSAIDSVLAQRYPAVEIIVVDDGSTDETYTILRPYQQEGKLVYVTQDNSGPAAARNHGIKLAHGEFIAFLDADDQWVPEKLAKQIPLFSNPDTALVYSDMHFTGGRTGLYSALLENGYKRGSVIRDLIAENFIPTSAVIVRHSILDESGLFLDDRHHVPIGEDYYLWLHIARLRNVDFVNEPLVEYSVHTGQLSADTTRTYASMIALFGKLLRSPGFDGYQLAFFRRYVEYFMKYWYTRFFHRPKLAE